MTTLLAGEALVLEPPALAEGDPEELTPLLGGKAAALAWLTAKGLPVPAWRVLTTRFLAAFLEATGLLPEATELLAAAGRVPGEGEGGPDLAPALEDFQERLLRIPLPGELAAALEEAAAPLLARGPLAVRSSGVLEDLAEASFAGQYRSFLHVRDRQCLHAAVAGCWASAFSPRVLGYAARRGLRPTGPVLAVILQEQVRARCAGVAFSVDPVAGRDDEILVEACPGLGDALVDGRVQPDRYRWAWLEEREREAAPAGGGRVLAPGELARLGRLVAAIQARQGRPVDVEWAWDGAGPQILQCRAGSRVAVRDVPGAWTTADLKDGGVSARVTTPLMASLYEAVFAAGLPRYLDTIGLVAREAEPLPWMRRAFGRLYWNVGQVKARLAALPGFCERSFDEDLGVTPAYEGDGRRTPVTPWNLRRGLRVLFRVPREARRCLATDRRRHPDWSSLVAAWEDADPRSLPAGERRRRLRLLLEEVHPEIEGAYFWTIYNVSNNQTLFRDRLRSLLGRARATAAALDLVGGLRDLSHLRAWREEEELATTLRRDPAALRTLLETDPDALAARLRSGTDFPGAAALRRHLARHGHLGPATLDLLVPRWSEDPRPVLLSLRSRLQGGGEGPPSAAGTRPEELATAARERVLAGIRGPLAPWRRRRFLASLELLRELLWWREEMRMLSTRVYAQVRRWTLAWGEELVARGLLEAPEDLFFLERHELLAWLAGGAPPPCHRERIRRARDHADAFRRFRNPDELGSWAAAAPASGSGSAWEGIPGSPGVARGTARVLHGLEEAHRLAPGDILVTRFTDPGWTHLFGGLAAVVTETGGILSHAAVIARECGFPAVLGVRDATACIPDGARIEVDGSRGQIRLVEDEA